MQERIVIGGIAKWEVSTAKRIEANRAMSYFNKMKEEAAEKLTERRKRLAAKLSRNKSSMKLKLKIVLKRLKNVPLALPSALSS